MSSIAGMIASIKMNKRNRVSTFNKLKDFKDGYNTELHFKKKSTPSQLKRIREKIQKENKQRLIKRIVLISSFVILLIYFVGFYKY